MSNDNSVVIRSVDKGEAVEVQNKEAYTTEGLCQLGNSDFKGPLNCDPTLQFAQESPRFLNSAIYDQLYMRSCNKLFPWHPLVGGFHCFNFSGTVDELEKKCH